ncbi:MAG: hypothetical protein Tsb009_00120 [Planctomycetaceae bacterium]
MVMKRFICPVVCLTLISSLGCSTVANAPVDALGRIGAVIRYNDAVYRARAERQRETNEALIRQAQNEEEARLAELELQNEREAIKFKESIRSKLGLSIDQKLEIGNLQVNETQLSEMLTKRKKEREALQKAVAEMNDRIRQQNREALLKKAREALDRGDKEAAQKYMADCCRPVPNCSNPQEALTRTPTIREPLQAPITAEKIPFMLPVAITYRVDHNVERSRIRREPITREPLEKKPCCKKRCCPTCAPSCCEVPCTPRQPSGGDESEGTGTKAPPSEHKAPVLDLDNIGRALTRPRINLSSVFKR